jgi:hypothetical protein
MPLNAKIEKVSIYATTERRVKILTEGLEDIKGTCKITNIDIFATQGEGAEVEGYPDIRFVGV